MSIRAQRPALEYVLERLPATMQLSAGAFAVLTGIPIGILSAVKRLSVWDHGSMFVALLGQSMPVYWLGLMLIVVFAVQLRWLPASGMGQPQHLILPAITLGTFLIGLIIRLTRSSMLDVLGQEYIRTARAKGLSERTVLVQHALKNALIPVVTVLGLQVGTLLGGAALTLSLSQGERGQREPMPSEGEESTGDRSLCQRRYCDSKTRAAPKAPGGGSCAIVWPCLACSSS